MQVEIQLVGKPNHWSYKHRRIRIGRDSSCDVSLPTAEYPMVSREHAVLELNGEALSLSDARSGNGTYLRGERVSSASLRSGDTIRLGLGGPELLICFSEPAAQTVADAKGSGEPTRIATPASPEAAVPAVVADAATIFGAPPEPVPPRAFAASAAALGAPAAMAASPAVTAASASAAAPAVVDSPTIVRPSPVASDVPAEVARDSAPGAMAEMSAVAGSPARGVFARAGAEPTPAPASHRVRVSLGDGREPQETPLAAPPAPAPNGVPDAPGFGALGRKHIPGTGYEHMLEQRLNGIRTLLAVNIAVTLLLLLGLLHQNQQIEHNRKVLVDLRTQAQTAVGQFHPELDTRLKTFDQRMDSLDGKMKNAQDQLVSRMNTEIPAMLDKYIDRKMKEVEHRTAGMPH